MRFVKQGFSGSYDEKHDVLYVCRRGTGNAHKTEEMDGLVIFRSLETGEVSGVIVYDFLKKLTDKEIVLDSLPTAIRPFVDEFTKEL